MLLSSLQSCLSLPARRSPSALAALLVAGFSSNARAHGPFGVDTSIWTSSYHLATSPLSIAALIGLTLVVFGLREPASIVAAVLAALGSVLATVLPPHMPAGPVGLAVIAAVGLLGLGALTAWKPPAALAFPLALMAGLAAGAAAEVDNPRWQDLVGMAATVLIVSFWLLAASDHLNRNGWLQTVLSIGRRVLGSWIAAIALLLGALALMTKTV